ncbi:hypothetical protein AB0N64_14580 [Microbacterium sp. NPDC089318]
MTEGRDFQPFEAAERAEISESMLAFLGELKEILLSGFGPEPAGSRAERLGQIHEPSFSQGPYPGRNAMETALFATLAGVDHAQAVAHALRSPDLSFSLATLTRGAVESYGRAWWLIEPEDDDELIVRWLSGLVSELSQFEKVNPGGILTELRGRNSDVESEMPRLLDEIEHRTKSRKPLSISYTRLATQLVDQIGANGRYQYSHLSGVAHGESMGHHGFVEVDDVNGVYRVGLDERWGISYARQTFAASSFVGKKMLALLGRTVNPGHPCAVAHDRAADLIWTAKARVFKE